MGELNDDIGLPIGNLTSQIFANIYLNELDKYIKHKLRGRHYFRYADDFIMVHDDVTYLQRLIPKIQVFLKQALYLELHPKKVILRKLSQGIDFLGYVALSHHIVLRTRTKQRIFNKLFAKQSEVLAGTLDGKSFNQSAQSYLGALKHCNGYHMSVDVQNIFGMKR